MLVLGPTSQLQEVALPEGRGAPNAPPETVCVVTREPAGPFAVRA
jgi:hypothetical protein